MTSSKEAFFQSQFRNPDEVLKHIEKNNVRFDNANEIVSILSYVLSHDHPTKNFETTLHSHINYSSEEHAATFYFQALARQFHTLANLILKDFDLKNAWHEGISTAAQTLHYGSKELLETMKQQSYDFDVIFKEQDLNTLKQGSQLDPITIAASAIHPTVLPWLLENGYVLSSTDGDKHPVTSYLLKHDDPKSIQALFKSIDKPELITVTSRNLSLLEVAVQAQHYQAASVIYPHYISKTPIDTSEESILKALDEDDDTLHHRFAVFLLKKLYDSPTPLLTKLHSPEQVKIVCHAFNTTPLELDTEGLSEETTIMINTALFI